MADLATERIHPASAGVRRRASEQGRFAKRFYHLWAEIQQPGNAAKQQ